MGPLNSRENTLCMIAITTVIEFHYNFQDKQDCACFCCVASLLRFLSSLSILYHIYTTSVPFSKRLLTIQSANSRHKQQTNEQTNKQPDHSKTMSLNTHNINMVWKNKVITKK